MDRAKRHKPTIEEFRQMCGFPPEQWMMTWEFLASRLHEPRNAVGLGGPQKGGLHWDSWLDTFLDGGIGKALWGEGANRKWAYPEDRKEWVLLCQNTFNVKVIDSRGVESGNS